MSHLDLPRLHFRGDFVADVFTCNNDDIAAAFPAQQFVNSARVTVDTLGMDDATFAQWLRQIAPPFGIRAGWNLYGSGMCYLENATIHGAHATGGTLVNDPAIDPIIGAAVEFNDAAMVDLDPEGTLGTQIFCGELSVRKSNGLRLVGGPSRMYSRFVSRRNLGAGGFTAFSASWYSVVPPGPFTVDRGASPAMASFAQAQQDGRGLFLAFCIYLLAPKVSQTQLASDFALGIATRNPAFGKAIGTIGTWQPDEMTSIAVGRRMNAATSLLHNHGTFELNPAVARVDSGRRVVTVDLLNSFPEVDESLEKVNIGPVRLALARTGPRGTILTEIGDVPYDRPAYERQSGLIDVPFDASLEMAIGDQQLVLIQTETDTIVLAESDITIETDSRCIYLQEGSATDVVIRMHVKGAAPAASQVVQVRQFVTSNRTMSLASPSNAVVTLPGAIAIGTSGASNLRIMATRPGTCVITLAVPSAPTNSREFFLNVRVLPLDNYDSVPDADVTFDFVYQEVLRYYHLLFPAMSELLKLSDKDAVIGRAQAILDRIDPARFEKSIYMPVSRDMSDGKRRLLERWLNLQISDSDETAEAFHAS